MGVLASVGSAPVGWGACGPRSRYLGASPSGHPLLGDRPGTEDVTTWLLPCLFVRVGHRGQGVSHALVDTAISVAQRHGANALEAWPSSAEEPRRADAFVGREQLFVDLGFSCIARPVPERAIMRISTSSRCNLSVPVDLPQR